ncbi:MAG: cohesin domain-containing protein [Methanoregulaceae archaeon]
MKSRCLPFILLLLCCMVSITAAGGMAKISVSPSEANWKTGQSVEVKVMFDNNLNPLAKDISIYFDWNPEMLKYEGCNFKVGRSTVAGLLSSHELNMMLGDFTNGYPRGSYPLAVLKFKVIGPGDTPILVRIVHLNDMDGNTVKFVTGKGMYSITGDTVAKPTTISTTVASTYNPPAGQPTVIIVTPGTFTPIPTIPPSVVSPPPVLPTTYQAPIVVQPVQQSTIASGGVPAWPQLTPGATPPTPIPTTITTSVPTTIPSPMPTTVVTTVLTTLPLRVFTTLPTRTQVTVESTTVPSTTVTTVTPTPTATPELTWTPIPTTPGQIAYQTGVVQTPTQEETPAETPSVDRTLPSPLGGAPNWTDDELDEESADWPVDETPTVDGAFGGRVTSSPVINNTTAAIGTPGSIFGSAWMMALAAIAGIALVALGVVAVRRTREDEL